jgi:hypothetical protein
MKRSLLCACVAMLTSFPAAAGPGVPVQGEADVPAATAPAATVELFTAERFSFTEGDRYRTVTMPNIEPDRIVLTVTGRPSPGEPWDRILGISLGGVELLRATTPRTTFTLRRDVTRYAAAFPPGATVDAGILSGSWIGGQWWEYDAHIDLYVDEPTAALVEPAADGVTPSHRWARLSCAGDTITRSVTFGADAPSSAELEITISGHGQDGEFWYINGGRRPRIFHVLVDGVEVGQAVAMPWVYALAGFDGNVNDSVHYVVWWTAFQALDILGVHGGVGEVPSYRAAIDAEHLPLLTGTRAVSIVQENGVARSSNGKCLSDANWVTSASFVSQA